jgi:hypothetical protein
MGLMKEREGMDVEIRSCIALERGNGAETIKQTVKHNGVQYNGITRTVQGKISGIGARTKAGCT